MKARKDKQIALAVGRVRPSRALVDIISLEYAAMAQQARDVKKTIDNCF